MTLFHFTNCVALAYVPYFIVYKNSGLAEYSAFWKCVQASVMYLVTQLAKMLFLATFFPVSDVNPGSFNVVGEFLKTTVDVADLFGLYFVMSQIAGKGQLKFMIAGVGWALAELVTTGFLPLWFGARGIEFDWKYIQMSFLANVSLVQHIVTAMLVWLYSRSDLSRASLPVVVLLLVLSCCRPFVIQVLSQMLGVGMWIFLVEVFFTFFVGLVSLQVYLGLAAVKESNSHY